jgi:hypothetical protein
MSRASLKYLSKGFKPDVITNQILQLTIKVKKHYKNHARKRSMFSSNFTAPRHLMRTRGVHGSGSYTVHTQPTPSKPHPCPVLEGTRVAHPAALSPRWTATWPGAQSPPKHVAVHPRRFEAGSRVRRPSPQFARPPPPVTASRSAHRRTARHVARGARGRQPYLTPRPGAPLPFPRNNK